MREKQFQSFATAALPCLRSNDDDALPDFFGSFAKTLPQNENGTPQNEAYEQLLRAVRTGRPQDFLEVPLGWPMDQSPQKLANPQAAFSFALSSVDPWDFTMPPAPSVTSSQAAAEIVEVYAMALLRDVAFLRYEQEANVEGSDVRLVLQGMNQLQNFAGPKESGLVTARTLFRGNFVGDLTGNYVSQFLYLPVPSGAHTIEQKYCTRVPSLENNFLSGTRQELLAVESGRPVNPRSGGAGYRDDKQFIVTARDIAEYVHFDYPYQPYLNAGLILLGAKARFNSGNPYVNGTIDNQGPFVTLGMADLLDLMGPLCRAALQSAWVEKWVRNRRLRPEVMALRIDQVVSGDEQWSIDDQCLPANNVIVERIPLFSPPGSASNYLLPMAYPEGSPAHPAYPSGHATIAGACCTLLKAFFDGTQVFGQGSLPSPVEPSDDGQTLLDYSGSAPLTLNGELNKLASNIANARNMAGVHYRSDCEGILLGERIALQFLRNHAGTYNEPLVRWTFMGFEGQELVIVA